MATDSDLPFICPTCDTPLNATKDDIGTTYYKCETHGNVEHPKKMVDPSIITEPFKEVEEDENNPAPEGWLKAEALAKKERLEKLKMGLDGLAVAPDIEDLLLTQVHQTVSAYDDHIVKVAFHVALSMYGKPLNLALKCESGSGKTYSTLETLRFLPPENVFEIGTQSPKVFTHEYGVKKTRDGELLEGKEPPVKPKSSDFGDSSEFHNAMDVYIIGKQQWDAKQKDAIYEVDLRGKSICFLESINNETFKMLKTTMSHDAPYIDHKFVDDMGKVHVTRLVGAPVMIFNSLDTEYVSEFATRCLTATPNTRREKVEDANRISNLKSCYPWLYSEDVFQKQLLQEYIRKVRDAMKNGKLGVINPFDGLYEAFSKEAVRDMRDFNKFLELMPSYAIFKLFQRPIITLNKKRYVVPTVQDVLDAKDAYDAILETTKTGTDYRILEFYYTTVADRVNGCDADTLTDLYNKERKLSRKTTVKTVRTWLTRLEELGWVDVRDGVERNSNGYVDRRFNNYFPMRAKNTPITADSKTGVLSESILEKSFGKWINNVSCENSSPLQIIMLNIDGTAKRLTVEDMQRIVLQKNSPSTPQIQGHVLSNDLSSNPENMAESTAELKTAVIGVFF